jgi:hypothetical protein
MGIVFDPELYRATEKHFAPYPLPACSKSPFQTWHTDAVFENGYCATVMFAFTGPLHTAMLQVVDASGAIAVQSMQFFEAEECHWATDGYDIHLGENYFRGDFPKLEIHITDEDNDAGADLLVESLIMPTISELPDGVGVGRMRTPNMPVSVAWFFMPWNRITGTLTVGGEKVNVSGHGWSDHQYGTDDFFTKACHYYYWATFPLGEHTITVFEAQGGPAQGYRPIKWLWDFKGSKLYAYERNADFYVFTTDIDEGDTLPKKLVYVFEDSRIRGKVTCDWKVLMQKQPVDAPPLKAILDRSTYDCRAEMVIDGKEIDTSFVRILETAYTLDPAPGTIVEQTETPAAQSVAPAQAMEEKPVIDDGAPSLFSIKSKLGKVLKDPKGNAILEKYLPGISKDPNTKFGYGMTLKMLFSMPQTGVSKEMLAQMDIDLRKIK